MSGIERGNGFLKGAKVTSQLQRQRPYAGSVVGSVLTVPSKPENVVDARKYTAKVAKRCGFSEDAIYDIKLAVSEALTNAVMHGSPRGNDNFVQVVFLCDRDRMRIIVIDEGAFGRKEVTCDYDSEGGRGLDLISCFMDYVSIHPSVSGTSVTMIKNVCRNDLKSAGAS